MLAHRNAFVLLLTLALACAVSARLVARSYPDNPRPLIGLLTQPTESGYATDASRFAYAPACYVKFLEGGGGRVVPIPFDADEKTLDWYFEHVNGLFYMGGADILNGTQYYKAAAYLYKKANVANKAGDFFPIWGTCLGFEFLSVVASGTINILTPFAAENILLHLNYTDDAKSSRLFGNAPTDIFNEFSEKNITVNWHHWGVGETDFHSSPGLAGSFKVLSTNNDLNGKTFVSSMEHFDYPFYATQFHPERVVYEFSDPTEKISHDPDAVAASQYFERFFISEAKKSGHSMDPKDEDKHLIYLTPPTFSGRGQSYDQIYYFPAFKKQEL